MNLLIQRGILNVGILFLVSIILSAFIIGIIQKIIKLIKIK